MTRRPVLIDTDTGVDDALALRLALISPEIEVVGITTVAGNVEVHRCTRNVRFLLQRWRIHAPPPVIAGASRPLRLPLVTAPEVHGPGGLGSLTPRSAPKVAASGRDAGRFICEQARLYGPDLTIVAIGPLTNLAYACRLDPRAMRRVGQIISMGGAFYVPGNTGPVAEFNYFVDPHAVECVAATGVRLLILPLDVTETFVVTWQELYRRTGPPALRWMRPLTRGYMRYHVGTEGFLGAYVHDPMAVAEAITPGMLRTETRRLQIVTREGPARGMSSAQALSEGSRTRVRVATGVDHDTCRMLLDRIWRD